ncbi:pirin family protein [Gordonia aquimaris]|uniref:Pirin family protein n=1 Tax=Gordonia aquimaris TaxID=2984863 RepID=A0A9X3D060_9ACTN|nr:pirin family protein [Gordonia aquimaris]MCX2962619.1 pirin family protein [Gordonia aquimaris]
MTQIIRAHERIHWRNEWLDSRQSFPATGNFDLAANAHGVLLVHNDDRVDAAEGLDMHQHVDTEILTWVVQGVAAHRDSTGTETTIRPGEIQRMTAGHGIRHSERNPAPRADPIALRVIQMWIAPDRLGLEPGYAQRDVSAVLDSGEPVVAASGMPEHADGPGIALSNRHAALHVARPTAGRSITLPGAPFGHLFVAVGHVSVADITGNINLEAGDAIRFTGHDDIRLTAQNDAEILYWQMESTVAR